MKDKWKCKNPIICKFSKPPGHQETLHYLTETSKKQIFKNQNFKNIKVQKGMMKIQDQQRGKGKGIA